MANFDKVKYWKTRMKEKIERSFQENILLFRDVRDSIKLFGDEPPEFVIIINQIARDYDELLLMVDRIGEVPKEKKTKKSLEEKN